MKSTRKILTKILSPRGYEPVEVVTTDEIPSPDKSISTPKAKPSQGYQPIPVLFHDVPLTPPKKEEKPLIAVPAKPAPQETNHCKFM